MVIRNHPQIDLELTYVLRIPEAIGDGGDIYNGLDRFGRVVDHRWADGSSGVAASRLQYTYDRSGNRTSKLDIVNSIFNEAYNYDGLNQLIGFDRNGGDRTIDWDYDTLGNFQGVDVDGVTETRTHNRQNEVTSVGSNALTFDANGNMTTDEAGRQFVYDAWNRLVEVKNSGGATLETFGYDGSGWRVTETVGPTTRDFYYSAGWQVLEEKVGANTTARYVWSPVYVDAMILRDRDTDSNGTLDERLWAVQDANFNVVALVDGTGTVVERNAYDPFGAVTVLNPDYSIRSGGSAFAWKHGFQGKRYDAIIGLQDNSHRWYSVTLGRFVTMDPIRYAAGDVNLYRFVGNSPEMGLDPWGMFSIDFKYAAFIHKDFGEWANEPVLGWATGWQFKGDMRDYRGDIEDSRLFTQFSFDTNDIGKINGPVANDTRSGMSIRKRSHTYGHVAWMMVNPFADKVPSMYETATAKATGSVTAKSSGNDTVLTIKASGAYPLGWAGAAAPSIDFSGIVFLSKCAGKVKIWGSLQHDQFPYYEFYINSPKGEVYWYHFKPEEGSGPGPRFLVKSGSKIEPFDLLDS